MTDTAVRYPFGADKRLEGKVILVNKRGYGFISCKDVPYTRIYFHWTNLIPQINFADLRRGDTVDFILEKKDDGTYKAIKVDAFDDSKNEVTPTTEVK
jgi:cold shock CspA family protein